MADIFLSYSTRDTERVRPLVEALERMGWTVWWDRKVPPGKTWRRMIEEALDASKCVLVIWSANSIESRWVIEEADEGHRRGVFFPVLIDDVSPPLGFRSIQAVRLIQWSNDHSDAKIITLIESLQSLIGIPKTVESNEFVLEADIKSTPILEKSYQQRQKDYAETLSGGVKLEMVAIPGGSFMMGSKTFESSQPIHKVMLQPFFISKYQITQRQWEVVMGDNPSRFRGDTLPVEKVSWGESMRFCEKISEVTGKDYRLPTEAEWEYASRAGSTGDYCFGNDHKTLREYAWYEENSDGKTQPVGLKKPNSFELYDVHGNVWEWCEDVWHYDYEEAPYDGSAWIEGGDQDRRVVRGGSWNHNRVSASAVARSRSNPFNRNFVIGFRVVSAVRPPS